MVLFPNAKINLGLNITEKRHDGYHNIETVFFPIPYYDVLEVNPVISYKNPVQIKISGPFKKNVSSKNICVKAYKTLAEKFDIPPVKIFLYKNIPVGSGLGGGSADATFTLMLLNKMFKLDLSREQLHHYASGLGSDCPFFLENVPSFAFSKGNYLQPIGLSLKNYHILVIYPDILIETKKMYELITPLKPKTSLKKIICQPVNKWKDNLVNDFEKVAFKLFPQLSEIKSKLYQYNALYCSMSGSGSALFAIFHKDNIDKAVNIFKKKFIVNSFKSF